jgi:hypothetical protein
VPGGVAAATRTLPRDLASFTGRQRELEQLVEAAANARGVVGIHAIGGMAGVGKTAFAVHAAHRLAGRFPDGQIFLPLHGHTPGQRYLQARRGTAPLTVPTCEPSHLPRGASSEIATLPAAELPAGEADPRPHREYLQKAQLSQG